MYRRDNNATPIKRERNTMTNVSTKKTATAPITFAMAFADADANKGKADDAHKAFNESLAVLINMGVTVADLKGASGKDPAGKHIAVCKDAIAKRVLTAKQYQLVMHSDKPLQVSNKITVKGTLNKLINTRVANLRKALEKALAVKAKGGANQVKNNSVESALKHLLDDAAKVAKLMGEAKTEAQTQAKALWCDVDAANAVFLEAYDKIVAIAGKHGGGKN